MMQEIIYKYEFEITDTFSLMLPNDAKFLHVGMQGIQPCMWFEHSLSAEDMIEQHFYIFATGQPFHTQEDGKHIFYLQTFMDSIYVWHLYGDL